MAKVKEQIMLNGGVITSMAMSNKAFDNFVKNVTSANAAFNTAEDLRLTAPESVSMHAAFCYGWWDNPSKADDGYWVCKNRWMQLMHSHDSDCCLSLSINVVDNKMSMPGLLQSMYCV
jgi:hypothetical protein